MAIAFARCAYVSRSSGGNACRKAAYTSRSPIACERTGETFAFPGHAAPAWHEVLLPAGADEAFLDQAVLWNEAERCERRKDSQVAKEMVLALPDDAQVSVADRIELTRRFVQENFVSKGVAVQVDVHAPEAGGHNWHAHLLITTRRFRDDGQGLASRKALDLDPVVRGHHKTVVEGDVWGEVWRDTQNTFFAEKGYDLQVDLPGILAQEHLGPVRMRYHQNREVARALTLTTANRLLAQKPMAILEALTRQGSLFTEKDLTRFLAKHGDATLQSNLKEAVLSHLSVLPLYDPQTGERTPFFTTQEARAEDRKLLRFAEALATRSVSGLSEAAIRTGSDGRSFSEEQGAVYRRCVGDGPQLRLIQGRAGVGKSYVLGAIRDAYEAEGFRVMGLAPTHKVAGDLKDSGFSHTQTCHGFLFAQRRRPEALPTRTLMVVDEAGLMGSALSIELFHQAKQQGARLILVGDDRQLGAVGRSGAFGFLAEQLGAFALTEVRRQQISWQRQVSEALSQGYVKDAVGLLKAHTSRNTGRCAYDISPFLLRSFDVFR